MVFFPLAIFATHPLVLEGNDLYRERNFQKAFEKFYDYLFHTKVNGEDSDYYIALIGAMASARELNTDIFFDYHLSLWNHLIAIRGRLPLEKYKELIHILDNSVFWDSSRNNLLEEQTKTKLK